MFSEPCTPGHSLEDSFSETKPPAFDLGKSGPSEASIIQAKLNRRLGPEYVSQRPSPGGGPKLTYIEGWKIIGLANEVFGYNGWCSTVTRIDTDFIDTDPESRRCSVGVTAIVKVTLKDGTYHEDIGYGNGENLKSKGAALDKAKKEAVTDGVKRALRNFGNLLGLCLYEKSFAQEVIKIKPQLPKFDQSDLHRREKLDTTPPSPSSSHDIVSPMVVSSTEDVKLAPSLPPQIRSAPSKPSPLRNTLLGAVVPRGHGEQLADRQEKTSPAQARPRNPNEIVQVGRLPQQGSSSKREVPLPRPEQFDVKSVAALAHQPSDPDLDSYFNDEDNDAFLAVEDSAMQGMEFSDALGTSSGQSVIHNANPNSEISRGGSPPVPASVKFAKSACCPGVVQLTRS
ncbi:Rad52/22 family double-strand break repair protein-domain-containing protein [Lactarius sanguifluus]|nr:Rad52/22 family double-strand break repair protein-domain-containing protein [Lactarius sanguifluus]